MFDRVMWLLGVIYCLTLYSGLDVISVRRGGARLFERARPQSSRPSLRRAIKIALTTNAGKLAVNGFVTGALGAFWQLIGTGGYFWGWGHLTASAIYFVLAFIAWWNTKGKAKLAVKLSGYKHRARLARMGVTPVPV